MVNQRQVPLYTSSSLMVKLQAACHPCSKGRPAADGSLEGQDPELMHLKPGVLLNAGHGDASCGVGHEQLRHKVFALCRHWLFVWPDVVHCRSKLC